MRIPASPGARRPCPAPAWVCGASSLPPLARALSVPCRSGVSSLRMNTIGSSASEGQRSLLRTQAISLHGDLSPPPRAGCSQQPAAHSLSRGGRRERARPAGRRGSVTHSAPSPPLLTSAPQSPLRRGPLGRTAPVTPRGCGSRRGGIRAGYGLLPTVRVTPRRHIPRCAALGPGNSRGRRHLNPWRAGLERASDLPKAPVWSAEEPGMEFDVVMPGSPSRWRTGA